MRLRRISEGSAKGAIWKSPLRNMWANAAKPQKASLMARAASRGELAKVDLASELWKSAARSCPPATKYQLGKSTSCPFWGGFFKKTE
jgi:hypothetical protein